MYSLGVLGVGVRSWTLSVCVLEIKSVCDRSHASFCEDPAALVSVTLKAGGLDIYTSPRCRIHYAAEGRTRKTIMSEAVHITGVSACACGRERENEIAFWNNYILSIGNVICMCVCLSFVF